MTSTYKEEYRVRINRVMDYIEHNIDSELTLKKLADVACFSPFHFHRIFSVMVNETLNQFISRIRVEKAAVQLLNNKKKSITAVALDCGFSGSATFARAFKDAYHISASEWRNQKKEQNSKNCKTHSKQNQAISKLGKVFKITSMYFEDNKQTWRLEMQKNKNYKSTLETKVQVQKLDDMPVAYVRHIGPYKGDVKLFENLFSKLTKWAGPRGIFEQPDVKMLSVYHDNPEITDEDKLRLSVCITIPQDVQGEGEVGTMSIPGGEYAIAHFEIRGDQFPEAWSAVYGGWLPESGYQPDDRPSFEICHNDPKEHPEGKHIIDICVPVRPL